MTISAEKPEEAALLDTEGAAVFLFGTNARANFYRLYRMRAAEQIKPVKIGGKYYYVKKELQKLVRSNAD